MSNVNQEPGSQFSFPGAESFPEEQRGKLGELIQDLLGSQPKLVGDICAANGIGWRSDGFPDYEGVNLVERRVKNYGCALIAMTVADSMGKQLTPTDIVRINQQQGFVYENIPEAVRKFLELQG